jgi:hypothetical protein
VLTTSSSLCWRGGHGDMRWRTAYDVCRIQRGYDEEKIKAGKAFWDDVLTK